MRGSPPIEASHIGQVVEARRRLKVQQKIRKLRAIPVQVGAKRQVFAHEILRGRFEEIGANPNDSRPEVSAPGGCSAFRLRVTKPVLRLLKDYAKNPKLRCATGKFARFGKIADASAAERPNQLARVAPS